MCIFCEALTTKDYKDKKIHWSVRSTMADDNIEELLGDGFNYNSECMKFSLYGHKDEKENTWVHIDYKQIITAQNDETAIIYPFSDLVQFNFCPMCGKQISKTIKPFEDNHDFIIRVEEE